jgi:hypothetical protein
MTSRNITLTQFTTTFCLFGLLLVAALLWPETTLDLPTSRLIYSIWVTIVLMTPAICLFVLPNATPARRNYWLLFWTFSFLAYMVHFYYAVFVHYHGSIREVYASQGVRIATSNFLVTAWWGFDVVLAWFVDSQSKWIRVQRVLAHIYIPLTFFIASVVIFKGFVNVLGIAMTASILICVLVRVWLKLSGHPLPADSAAQQSSGGGK